MIGKKYREYFDIDERYFPCIDDSAIQSDGNLWRNTYPHETFIRMLTEMERALSRINNGKTLWIEGAYGTGKSQCAYALRKILEVSEEELQKYWNDYEPLKGKQDLLNKLIGHKRKGLLIAHRYASGSIQTSRDLFFAIQEAVNDALKRQNMPYHGENTLKESVIAWLEDKDHRSLFDSLLSNPEKEWKSLFAQSNTDSVLSALRKNNVTELMSNIFQLADKEGITALSIDSDRLIAWLTDIIDNNNTKIVLIWDEFSDYFKNNQASLSEFQKIAALVQNKPFYFIVVTHEAQQMYVSEHDRGMRSKIADRFVTISIELPDNIAFHLIGHAFKPKEAAQEEWTTLANELNNRVQVSRSKVMQEAKIEGNDQVIKEIMPLHPMTALILKHLAKSFRSNQRSMFDFIKSTNTDDVQAFQWFIENNGPYEDRPLLTVDMLWNFFYEKGKEHLTESARLILDTFQQQQDLRKDEESVLKAILIMQAIDRHLGGSIGLFKPTGQNLSYVFEGSDLDGSTTAKNIADGLKTKGILITTPVKGNLFAYEAAVLAGDQTKIDGCKKTVRESSSIQKLVLQGELATVLPLSAALRPRFESEPNTGKITPVTINDFTRTINTLREKSTGCNFHAVIAFAKDNAEVNEFRKKLKDAVADEQYQDIVFIDALSTPLDPEAFERYVDFSGMALYYQGSQNSSSREYDGKARQVLQEWRNLIYNGSFLVYTYSNQEGDKLNNGQGVLNILQTIVTKKFPYVFDFANGITESQFKSSSTKAVAISGITQKTSGIVVGLEKHTLLPVWHVDRYWENASTRDLPISKIKMEIDKQIEEVFARDGQIAIGDIYDILENTYGFAPCNLSAFLTGFLLKEYAKEPYSYGDSAGAHESMSPDKLAEMIGNYISKKSKPSRPTYIVKMTSDEKAFYEFTEKAWKVSARSCASIEQATRAVIQKMREFKLPIWCCENASAEDVFGIVQKYVELVQTEGAEAHKKALEIGNLASKRSSLAKKLADLLTSENCQKGMREYLKTFEDGQVIELAMAIGAENNLLSDVSHQFESVKHSYLWDKSICDDEIRKLITMYGIIKESNDILNTVTHSLDEAYQKWHERLTFMGVSCESLQTRYVTLAGIFGILLKIYKHELILPESLKTFLSELTVHHTEMENLLDKRVFDEVYEPYLDGLSEDDISQLKSQIQVDMFGLSAVECNTVIKDMVEKFHQNLVKTQLVNLWKTKTKSKDPREWSNHYRTPILCCVSDGEFSIAKKIFDTLNRHSGTDAEIQNALDFLESTELFDILANEEQRNEAFKKGIVGEYGALLPDLDRIRDKLDLLSMDVYEWYDNPNVKNKVKQLAEAEYNAGGSDKVLQKIDEMDASQLREYLKRLIKDSMAVGMEILLGGGEE